MEQAPKKQEYIHYEKLDSEDVFWRIVFIETEKCNFDYVLQARLHQ